METFIENTDRKWQLEGLRFVISGRLNNMHLLLSLQWQMHAERWMCVSWNETENLSYLLHLHFSAEPLWAKWNVWRILRCFLNRNAAFQLLMSTDWSTPSWIFSTFYRLFSESVLHHSNAFGFIIQRGWSVLHRNEFCIESSPEVPLNSKTGRQHGCVWLNVAALACLFCHPRDLGLGRRIKYLGHVAFFIIRVCSWYTPSFKCNCSHWDEQGHCR